MVVSQLEAISRRDSEDIAARFKARAAEMRRRVGEAIADEIVNNSPVDTGTYVMAHVAGAGDTADSGGRTSHGKKRGQNKQQFQNLARGNLKRSVLAEAIEASGEIWFRNRAAHAARVEFTGWPAPLFGNPNISGPGPYHVYAKTAAMVPTIIRRVAAEMGMQAR